MSKQTIALPVDYDSIMKAIEITEAEVRTKRLWPTELWLSRLDYENLKEEVRECVGHEYYGKKRTFAPEQFDGMTIMSSESKGSFIVAVEKEGEINPSPLPGKMVHIDQPGKAPSRQDWQGATDDEINTAIKNCPGDTDHDRSVKAALVWVMDAVKNPHPLE